MDISPIDDGISHINAYSKGATELGRLLSNLAHTPFVLDGERWESLEAWWYYQGFVGSTLEGTVRRIMQRLHGHKAKTKGEELRAEYEHLLVDHDNFEAEILRATREKLVQNKNLYNLLASSELPIVHYYYYGKPDNAKVIASPGNEFQLKYIEDCREKIHARSKLIVG